MTKLSNFTKKLKEMNKKAFVPFFTAFYPTESKFAELLFIAQSTGADILEIGIPFSDPIADGEYIQYSSQWVLERGFKMSHFLSFFKEIRKEIKVPVVLMSYINPIYKFGFERFASFMQEQGIEGIIFPDLPLEESRILGSSFRSKGISVINMIAPSTKEDRIKIIAKKSDGFIYLISVYGVTGVRNSIDESIKTTISTVKAFTDKPVYIGFGISSPDQASIISKDADGIIVGSIIIKILRRRENNFPIQEIRDFLKNMRGAI
jgi:tryptophan synthase alpha chain